MCTRAGARSVAHMSRRLIPLAAAAAMAAGATPAHAAGWTYGGTTSSPEPIVITASKGAKKLSSLVVGWRAPCDDGMYFPVSQALTPAVSAPGFTPGPRELVMTRNAKGRFKGSIVSGFMTDSGATAVSSFQIEGKLFRTRASGTLSGTVKIMDSSGNTTNSCQTDTMRWSATRAPGKVFGGQTSEEEPVVVRADARHRMISDVMITWESQTCTPPAFVRIPERFQALRLHSGAFTAGFNENAGPFDDGSKAAFAYNLAGRVTRTSVKGTLHVTMTETDAAGAQTMACDSGNITWKALTG
jgi:hypothetical protein